MTDLQTYRQTGVLAPGLNRYHTLLLAGVWLYFHSYQGLVHDARLYALQALRVLQPASLENDLFFAYGSQDSFTLFPQIHAVFVAVLGLSGSGLTLTLTGQILWLTGAIALFKRIEPFGPKLIWGLIALVALPADYGAYIIFEYGEGFLTARLYAEALTLWSLAVVLQRRRWVVAGSLAAVAFVLHPIYGAVALSILLCLLILEDKRWAVLVVIGAACVIGLALAGAAPFSALFTLMDPEWRGIVEKRNVVCFPTLWRWTDFAGIILDAVVIVMSAAVVLTRSRVMLFSILAVGLGGLAAATAGDIANNLLLVQLQPSRALWLVAAAANFCVGAVAYDLVRRETGRAVLALLSVGFLLQLFPYFAISVTFAGAWFTYRLLSTPASRPPVIVQSLAYTILVGGGCPINRRKQRLSARAWSRLGLKFSKCFGKESRCEETISDRPRASGEPL